MEVLCTRGSAVHIMGVLASVGVLCKRRSVCAWECKRGSGVHVGESAVHSVEVLARSEARVRKRYSFMLFYVSKLTSDLDLNR